MWKSITGAAMPPLHLRAPRAPPGSAASPRRTGREGPAARSAGGAAPDALPPIIADPGRAWRPARNCATLLPIQARAGSSAG